MIQKPKAEEPIRLDDNDVEEWMRAETKRVNEMIRAMPKAPVSARIPVIHQMMLSAIATETGLTMSEVVERLLMAGGAQALKEKGLPAVEDYPAVAFKISGQDEGAA